MKINEFKEGDIVTRIGRTSPRKNMGFGFLSMGEDVGDGSYIGDKLEFVGHDKDTIMCITSTLEESRR